MSELDITTISPGVRDLVAALRDAGLHTTDSGDGSNHAAGMGCALPFPHVFVVCPSGSEKKTIISIKYVLAEHPWLIDWPVDVEAFDPAVGEPGCVAVWHADRDAICKRVGYEWGAELWADDVPDSLRSKGWTRIPRGFTEAQLLGVRPTDEPICEDGKIVGFKP